MKKNLKSIEILKQKISKLEKTKNSISDESRAEVDALIDEFKLCIEEIEAVRDEAENAEDDKTIEMESRINEILRRLSERETPAVPVADKIKNAVNSPEYIRGFFDCVKNSANAEDFRANYRKFADEQFVKNGIYSPSAQYPTSQYPQGIPSPSDLVLPGFVINEINDIYTSRHPLLSRVDWTGLPVYRALFETRNEVANTWPHVSIEYTGGDYNPAQQWVPGGDSNFKKEQNLNFEKIDIRPAYLYKYITIEKELVRATEDQGDILLRYITRELVDRLLYTLEHLILWGNDENFISPLKREVTTETDAETEKKVVVNLPGIDLSGANMTTNMDRAIAVLNTRALATIKSVMRTASSATLLTISNEDVAAFLSVSEIIITEAATGDNLESGYNGSIIIMVPDSYKLVGDTEPIEYRDFNLARNKDEFLTEMYIGGGNVVPGNQLAYNIYSTVAEMAAAIRGDLNK